MAAVGFSDLPTEALDEIARRVGPLDNLGCSAVCRPWRGALKCTRLGRLRRPGRPHNVELESYKWSAWPKMPKKPWTRVWVHPPGSYGYSSEGGGVGTFVDDDGGKTSPPSHVIGCSHGWVVAVDEASCLLLLEYATGRRFPLPRITNKDMLKGLDAMGVYVKFQKAALVSGRRLGTYAVMLIYSRGHRLAFLGPGNKSWTTLCAPRSTWMDEHKFVDAVFHKGAFYTVSNDTGVIAWVPDKGSIGLRSRRVTEPRQERVWAVLVESPARDGLLMVSAADLTLCLRGEQQYEVSRCDEQQGTWVAEKNNGDFFIYAQNECSFCVAKRVRGVLSQQHR